MDIPDAIGPNVEPRAPKPKSLNDRILPRRNCKIHRSHDRSKCGMCTDRRCTRTRHVAKPVESDMINVAMLNELTGNDRFTGRKIVDNAVHTGYNLTITDLEKELKEAREEIARLKVERAAKDGVETEPAHVTVLKTSTLPIYPVSMTERFQLTEDELGNLLQQIDQSQTEINRLASLVQIKSNHIENLENSIDVLTDKYEDLKDAHTKLRIAEAALKRDNVKLFDECESLKNGQSSEIVVPVNNTSTMTLVIKLGN